MTNSEIKTWAKEKLKGKLLPVLGAVVVAGILTGLSYTKSSMDSEGMVQTTTYNFGWLFYFVEVGLAYYLTKFIRDEKYEFTDIFHFAKDFGRCIGARLLQMLWVFLYCLLLIIPGIIKGFGYVLVPYLMADEKYRSLSIPELLKKSEEMMKGHKMDYFLLCLSFIGWFLLILPTFGLIMIYVGPYLSVTQAKFLNEIKSKAEGNVESKPEEKPVESSQPTENNSAQKFCPNCGAEVAEGTTFCSSCGQQL